LSANFKRELLTRKYQENEKDYPLHCGIA
jgi:hypothetical protein